MSTKINVSIEAKEDLFYSPDGISKLSVKAGEIVIVNKEIADSLIKTGSAVELTTKQLDPVIELENKQIEPVKAKKSK